MSNGDSTRPQASWGGGWDVSPQGDVARNISVARSKLASVKGELAAHIEECYRKAGSAVNDVRTCILNHINTSIQAGMQATGAVASQYQSIAAELISSAQMSAQALGIPPQNLPQRLTQPSQPKPPPGTGPIHPDVADLYHKPGSQFPLIPDPGITSIKPDKFEWAWCVKYRRLPTPCKLEARCIEVSRFVDSYDGVEDNTGWVVVSRHGLDSSCTGHEYYEEPYQFPACDPPASQQPPTVPPIIVSPPPVIGLPPVTTPPPTTTPAQPPTTVPPSTPPLPPPPETDSEICKCIIWGIRYFTDNICKCLKEMGKGGIADPDLSPMGNVAFNPDAKDEESELSKYYGNTIDDVVNPTTFAADYDELDRGI